MLHAFTITAAIVLVVACRLSLRPSPHHRPNWHGIVAHSSLLPPVIPSHPILLNVLLLHGPRYFYPLNVTTPDESVYAHWDSEIGAAGDVAFGLWVEVVETGELFFVDVFDYVSLPTRPISRMYAGRAANHRPMSRSRYGVASL